ncbi:hypothetical protein ALP26_103349 [Pseudomonas savastanoi pv. glycinea]|uniref:Uncharacterized protein n=6 Tax=Pseudomonas syringae group TaxID=136849 RepID=A0A0P9Q6U7_PSECA|nr:Unknown protein sequence [Pseudomonas amygdali pv. sesami]KPC20243.1 Unknown protein sequence [Pseudomonas savastanoi pv. glycinea]KPW65947.1 hypothetical protein ALO81_102109 [Pseudomonas cannabina]KPW99570.1 hypothetical protein ALO79_100691 [Pseudomonas syringae pv. castaneae]KPX19942.1 hypothetical protein ALO71_102461 [Pseudomonas amygdali pv. dendropanacis]KPX47654.1 hypothetical protein ALO69_102787 [Pseudomonas ficuserectae]RMR21103.1 hypothetical protein ALP90_102324 [Pseudomonas 
MSYRCFGITHWAMTILHIFKNAADPRTGWGTRCSFARCDIQGAR